MKTRLFFLCFFVLLAGCAKLSNDQTSGQPKMITSTLPGEASQLSPGLAVKYIDGFYRHLNQMPPGEKGRTGKPVTWLNHRFGEDEVFASGRSRGVGIEFTGFIHLEKTGEYSFQALANDGIEVIIADTQVAWDPTVHSDRLSQPVALIVNKSGWYPIKIRYYQRKGTATLVLYQQEPGSKKMSIIPAKAYGYLAK